MGSYGNDPNGNDSNKQFWLLNPVEDPAAIISTAGGAIAVNLGAKVKQAKTQAISFSTPKAAAVVASSAKVAATVPAVVQKVDPHNQYTWTCQHPGKWLSEHEHDYIDILGHVECIAVLKAYKESLKTDETPAAVASAPKLVATDNATPAVKKVAVDPKNQLTWTCQHPGSVCLCPPTVTFTVADLHFPRLAENGSRSTSTTTLSLLVTSSASLSSRRTRRVSRPMRPQPPGHLLRRSNWTRPTQPRP